MEINHAERAHALLSPSSSARWTRCTMSVPLNQNYPDTSSTFAEEGTMAHELAEIEVRKMAGLQMPEQQVLVSDEYDAQEMMRHAKDYADYISSLRTSNTDTIGVEQRVALKAVVADVDLSTLCYGTADCIMVTDEGDTLHIIDYKYGKGVEVSAHNNTQLMLYACMTLFSALSKEHADIVKQVKLHIYQPRLGNISVSEMPVRELWDWFDEVAMSAIVDIIDEVYTIAAGAHCRWCKHRTKCKQYAMTYLDPTVQAMRLDVHSLNKDNITKIIGIKDELIKWLNELSDKVLEEMLAGEKYDGYKLVEGRSVRKITDADGAILYLRSKGYKEQDIFRPLELQNITALQKLMGKKAFDTEMAQFIEKPKGKPTIVEVSDKRAEYEREDNEAMNIDNFKI